MLFFPLLLHFHILLIFTAASSSIISLIDSLLNVLVGVLVVHCVAVPICDKKPFLFSLNHSSYSSSIHKVVQVASSNKYRATATTTPPILQHPLWHIPAHTIIIISNLPTTRPTAPRTTLTTTETSHLK